MDTSRFEQFSSLMTGAAKSIAKLKAAQMEAFSLSGAHTSCLCRLYEAGSLTQGELTRAVQMDRSQVSRVLRDLAPLCPHPDGAGNRRARRSHHSGYQPLCQRFHFRRGYRNLL